MATYEQQFPERDQGTINTADGSKLIIDMVDDNSEVTILRINNISTGGQTISLGFGSDAISGIDDVGQGFSWVESMDGRFNPWNGEVYIRASADGAKYSYSRRKRKVN